MLKLKVERDHLVIQGDEAQDVAYIQDTLGLREVGDSIKLVLDSCLFHGVKIEARTINENDIEQKIVKI